MDREQIRREVERLAPWYYAFDLHGVRTDELPACDDWGHRVVHFPEVRPDFWRGKHVLDVGCNEGAWTFGVLDCGAAAVDAFDVREINIEKARFVADLLGYRGARFATGDCESWFEQHQEPYDLIVFPGVLYHLPRPWETVRTLCSKAREGILVATALMGAEGIGYTGYAEVDNIAASKDAAPSMMPNNTATVIAEFRKHGFHPTHIYETRQSAFWGGCTLLMKNGTRWPDFAPIPRAAAPTDFELHITPDLPTAPGARRHPLDVDVAIYHLGSTPRTLRAALWVLDAGGARPAAPVADTELTLPPRVQHKGDAMSLSQYFRLELDLPAAVAEVELTLHDPATDAELRRARARLGTATR